MTNGNEPATGFVSADLQHDITGLTKREHFAAMAMQGFIAAHSEGSYVADFRDETLGGKCVAKCSVMFADALIEALNAKG